MKLMRPLILALAIAGGFFYFTTWRHNGSSSVGVANRPARLEITEAAAPETPDELLTHQALMQGTETWQFIDGDKTISVHPQGRFKADNGTALAIAAVAGLGIAWLPRCLVAGLPQRCGCAE